MEHVNKKRKLAPKVSEPAPSAQNVSPPPPPPAQFFPHDQQQPQPYQLPDGPAPPPPRDHDFESFARHLQDAAMYIYRHTQKSPYSRVSVLMLRWEDDTSVENDVAALEKVFRENYHFNTDRWYIPTTANPSIKLSMRMGSFLEHARPDHLLIIYYAGHGFVGADNQLYWACNAQEDACKLKWDGIRCLFEDAQSDILLLLDSCASPDAPPAGSHGVKQGIAAYGPDQSSREVLPSSFTTTLCDSLRRLGTGRPFSVRRLLDDILLSRQHEWAQAHMTNGSKDATPMPPRMPVDFTLSPAKAHSLSLSPLPASVAEPRSAQQAAEVDGQGSRPTADDDVLSPGAGVDLVFEEPRVLVCTTFVGEASPDMQFFNQWLHTPSPIASKVVVEGMFLGPPTMLLISMPTSIWSIVEHDKVCCYLGNIQSHNLTHLYKRLLGSHVFPTATAREVEAGRILLEAREAAASSSALLRRDTSPKQPVPPHTNHLSAQPSGSSVAGHANTNPSGANATPTAEVEDSAEMKEAAEQLKALSHVRHLSDEASAKIARQSVQIADSIDVRREGSGSTAGDANESGGDEGPSITAEYKSPPADKPRKSLLNKQAPKQETRCTLCSHAPFKDSSSLRKHIAAAHTRPFPCAFSFAGCTSTFGSKNEWKRHIASQHLCLFYYRCSACPQSTAEGRGNEFNRKDLFTQHLRRMHAPFAIKKSLSKADSKMQAEWENHVKEMQVSCLVTRRAPPARSACPKADCQSVFEGAGSWEEWTEHVGRHMEKGEGQTLGVDRLLAKWALDEGIIEPKGNGQYRLTSTNGMGGPEGGSGGGVGGGGGEVGNGSFVSDGGRMDDDDDPSITVATTALGA